MIGVAAAMGMSVEITAGAIISGAYFGDKLSPLSDTTNLASAVAGVELFAHIRHMLWTTLPSFFLALGGFYLLGTGAAPAEVGPRLEPTLRALEATFDIGVLMLLPLVAVIVLALRQVPAIASMLTGILLGILVAMLFQQPAVLAVAGSAEPGLTLVLLKSVWQVLFEGYQATTGDPSVDTLLSRGGMASMQNTVWLIISAMTFGAALESAGILDRFVRGLVAIGQSTGALISATLATCLGVNTLAGDQYMAIVIPGRMFRDEYARRRLAARNLSRTLEDAGTLTAGKRADFIVLDASPLEDIRNTRRIHSVYLAGDAFDRSAFQQTAQ